MMKALYFDDNADGNAYLVSMDNYGYHHLLAFVEALKRHDHICIVSDDTYYKLGDADFSTYAPYAITIEAGEFLNVNKL